MKAIFIDEALKQISNEVSLGCLNYTITVEKDSQKIWDHINSKTIPAIIDEITPDKLIYEKHIKDSREFYKKLGKDPSRYRISSEALLKRILQKKDLYTINNVVDINNLISMTSRYSVGSYDVSKLGEKLEFRKGNEGESYKGIGKEMINISYLPVFADEFGAYGSPTSDSERAMITLRSSEIMTVIISFSGTTDLEHWLLQAKKCFETFTNAHDFESKIIV
ncbi:tRNA-binding protein [Spirochaetia bacterium]|nr:tRNA-binding protein [Spirochaetia bacterium]